ncbi:MAG TPA: carboxypeptidase-like regulatory domain-containing protein [Salinimicrobium sp.]|nr:carboxypeptidase-like regulatory domain-containing protein [Salinimicrobium sp.]
MRYFILWFFLLPATIIYSQSLSKTTITGTVFNQQSQPIYNASVNLLNSRFKTKTDPQGRFSLENLSTGDYIINIEKEGYSEYSRRIRAGRDGIFLEIILQPSMEKLGEVVITAEKREELIQEIPLSSLLGLLKRKILKISVI